jgi:hypothetical protein
MSKIHKKASSGMKLNKFVIKNGVILKPKSKKRLMQESQERDGNSSSNDSDRKKRQMSPIDRYEPFPFTVE